MSKTHEQFSISLIQNEEKWYTKCSATIEKWTNSLGSSQGKDLAVGAQGYANNLTLGSSTGSTMQVTMISDYLAMPGLLLPYSCYHHL